MSKQDNEAVSASLQKAREATGIEEPEQSFNRDAMRESELEKGAKPESEEEAEETAEDEEISEEEDADAEAEDEEEAEEEGQEEESEKSNSERKSPTKPRSPLKAAFSQINELRKGQETMAGVMKDLVTAVKDLKTATPSEKKEAAAEVRKSVKDVLATAKEMDVDPAWITELVDALRSEIRDETGKEISSLKEALSKTEEATGNLAKKTEHEERIKEEVSAFTSEWNDFLPELQKTYPSMGKEMLTEARNLMRRLAVSKEYGGEKYDGEGPENKGKQPLPLDYILYRERKQFDSLLKVKSGKTGEAGGRQVGEVEDEEEVDPEKLLDPENMTPAKLKKWEEIKRKQHAKDGDLPLEIIG